MEDKKEELKYQIDAMRRIRKDAGMNRREFSEYMDIPLRTLEEWEAGRRKMPDYVLRLIAYQIRMEKFLSEKSIEVRGEDTYGEN
ncbi:MAG: helix-turn-helix domain-containing protein [Lachnospiraceae bacterium]|nr:helix-turn-helix domain-containing protein [Lachnospiraceae bacterium]